MVQEQLVATKRTQTPLITTIRSTCAMTPSSDPSLMPPGSAKGTESSRRRDTLLLARRMRTEISHLLAGQFIMNLKKSTSSRRARSWTIPIRAPSKRFAWIRERDNLLRLLMSHLARRTLSNRSCNQTTSLQGRTSTSSSLLICTLKQGHRLGGLEGPGRRERKQFRDLTLMSRCAMTILPMATQTVTIVC